MSAEDLIRMNGFFREPTEENYRKILQFRHDSRPEIKLYFISLKKTFGLGGPATKEEEEFLSQNVERLLCPDTILSALDLDYLWAMFSTTGDNKYSDRVKSAIGDSRCGIIVTSAASWSYNSFIRQGFLEN